MIAHDGDTCSGIGGGGTYSAIIQSVALQCFFQLMISEGGGTDAAEGDPCFDH